MHLNRDVRAIHLHDSRKEVFEAGHTLAEEFNDVAVIPNERSKQFDARLVS